MVEVKENMTEEITTRKNAFCVIAKEGDESGWHDLLTNDAWCSNPYGEAYAVVPDELVPEILETCGYCDLELNEDGTEVVAFTPLEITFTPEEEPEPTTEDDLLAMAVDHEYRLTLLELGVI